MATTRPSAGEWAALAAIVAGALALRLWNVSELAAHDPFFARPSVDELMYHEWAQEIAAGDWRGDQVFLNGPLYPYLLGGLYAVVGPSVYAARAAQALIGALSCAFDLVGRRAPLRARGGARRGGARRGEPDADLLRQRAGRGRADGAARAARGSRGDRGARSARGLRAGFAVGIASGLGALARPTCCSIGALCVAWAAGEPRRDRLAGRRAGWLAAFALGALVCIAPVTWHNYAVSGDFVPITYSGGSTCSSATTPMRTARSACRGLFAALGRRTTRGSSAPRSSGLRSSRSGRELLPSEESRFWSARALQFAREYPALEARLLWHKLEIATNAFEPWNIRSPCSRASRRRCCACRWSVRADRAARARRAPAHRGALARARAALRRARDRPRDAARVLRARALPHPRRSRCSRCSRARASPRRRAAARARAARGSCSRRSQAALAGVWSQREVMRDDLSIAYYNLGNRYRDLADWPRAIESYRRVIEARPTYVSAYNNLALVYEATGDHDALARVTWERVRELGDAQRLPKYSERAERHLRALAAFGEERRE
jgi:tetratricopeptide (TPR) repeat protein